MQSDRITSSYIHKLQAVYHNIDNRGIRIDAERIAEAKQHVKFEIARNCAIASNQWGCHVFVGAANALPKSSPGAADQVNLNATQGERALLKKLQDIGYKVPKIAKRNEEGEYEANYSTGELALQQMLVSNQYNYPGGDPAVRAILQVRELTKLQSSYLNCRFYRAPDGEIYYLTNYNAAGTLTGRRSSRKHTFGFGNNAQNFPKHGKLAKIFRRCLVARPGRIFLMVDQKGAEEWPVNALANNLSALAEMQAGVNRHIRRASRIFSIAETSRTEREWKASDEYYLGKKTGHANNYGMKAKRMSDSLAQEGKSINVDSCQNLLDTLNRLEPQTRGVFHVYIRDTISKSRILVTPFGRERQFLGMRPNDSNYKLFNEAFAFIPQSVVGDNTGFAVAYLEDVLPVEDRAIVQENHDSIVQDIPADPARIWDYLQRTAEAFRRRIRFHNGIELEIPVEAELGFDFDKNIKIKEPWSYENVVTALAWCNAEREKELDLQAQQKQMLALQNLAATGLSHATEA